MPALVAGHSFKLRQIARDKIFGLARAATHHSQWLVGISCITRHENMIAPGDCRSSPEQLKNALTFGFHYCSLRREDEQHVHS
jgi:hypothetical protein